MPFSAGSASNDQPTWTAAWCWTASPLTRPWNTYAAFRRGVDLPDRPTSAVIRISADARYTLYINGRRIHFGPARCFPHFQSYDTLDLADFLTAGPNAICALVHQFGISTGQSIYRDASGFLLDGVIETPGGSIPLHTPADWLCRPAAGWRKNVARLSPDLGFQEHVDADADPADWLLPTYQGTEESGWQQPIIVTPAGGHPWVYMQPRSIPLLTDEIVSFSSISGQFTGENARGYKVAEDVFHLPLQETARKAKPVFESLDAILRDDDHAATLPPPADGYFHTLVLDLGVIRTGHMILDIIQAAGDEIIDILYLQEIDKTGAPIITPGDNAPADRYRCRPGPQRWEAFLPKGFRYAALIFRNVEAPLKLRHVGVRCIQAAIDQVGAFECSDSQLNAIDQAGIQTLNACMTDCFVDSPVQTQVQRFTSARLAFRAAAYAFGDASLLERGIMQMARSQAEDGSLHAHPPAGNPRARTIESMCAWIGALRDLHFYTGKPDLLQQHRPTLERLLAFLAKLARDDGLLHMLHGFAAFDAAALEPHLLSARLNLTYLLSLRHAVEIYDTLELEQASQKTAARAQVLAGAIEKHFWDAKAKVWRDAFDLQSSTPVDQTSVYVHALVQQAGLKPEGQPNLARDVILKAINARRSKVQQATPAETASVLEVLIEHELRAEAIDLIRSKWGAMIDRGAKTLWEKWDGAGGSLCFAAATSPVYLLPQLVLGIMPREAGWQRVRIAPVAGALEFARGRVASPLGPIAVEWEKVGDDQLAVRVELPDGIEGEFVSPLGESRELESGVSEFHT